MSIKRIKLRPEPNWQTPRVETLLNRGYTNYQVQHLARQLEREVNTFCDILECKTVRGAIRKLNKMNNRSIHLPHYTK